jgi:hypothetical protein
MVAFFTESHDAVVSRDVVLHEKRAIAAGNEAATSLKEYVSHVHRLRASDNQVVGCVAIEIDVEHVDLLRAYGVVASTSLANMTEHVRFTGGKGAASGMPRARRCVVGVVRGAVPSPGHARSTTRNGI